MKTDTIEMIAPSENELRELGFEQAADQMSADKEMARKLRIAFEHFRIVKPEHIDRFNAELKANTRQGDGKNQWGEIYTYDRLKLTPIKDYKKVPPKDVLDKLREAKALNCFDTFEVATIESVRVIPDPIIFGTINGCPDKYYVAQWDNDVKIEQILKEDEG